MSARRREVGPNFEFPPEAEGLERQREKAMEERPAQESSLGQSKPAADAPAVQAPAIPAPPSVKPGGAVQSGNVGSKSAPTSGLTAHDVDLIEKQWVESAKSIVNQTKDDPYAQKKEMSKVKADYIKKRFNKTIPSDDTVTA